jgi:hypothetical protein
MTEVVGGSALGLAGTAIHRFRGRFCGQCRRADIRELRHLPGYLGDALAQALTSQATLRVRLSRTLTDKLLRVLMASASAFNPHAASRMRSELAFLGNARH